MDKMLIKVATEFNIGLTAIVEYLISKGFEIENRPTSKITDEMYFELLREFNSSSRPKNQSIQTTLIPLKNTIIEDKTIIEKNNSIKFEKINSSEVEEIEPTEIEEIIPIEIEDKFDLENPYEAFVIDIIHNGIDFENRIPENRLIGGEFIETKFTDFEAFSICLGTEEAILRKISREYFKGIISDKNLILAHNSSMRALQKYKEEYISLIFSLPPLPFRAFDAKQLFSEMDRRNEVTKRPVFRILIRGKKYILKFHEDYSKNFISNEIITVLDKKTKQAVFNISRTGHIIPKENINEIIPTLSFFIRNVADFKSYILNYGLESGECSVCGRTLTDPFSIRKGIGPVCGGYR
ncbi:MAG: hypothetical protein IPK88_04195 [Saprospiraceae bacterium]|nr:hypothetical protein [Candidatus Defluviibacterium haderslevense]